MILFKKIKPCTREHKPYRTTSVLAHKVKVQGQKFKVKCHQNLLSSRVHHNTYSHQVPLISK